MSKADQRTAPVADPTAKAPVVKPSKAAPIAHLPRTRKADLPRRVSPQFGFSVIATLDGYDYGPFTVHAVDESDAKRQVVNMDGTFAKRLSEVAWQISRATDDPVNASDLTDVQIEALNVERKRNKLEPLAAV